MIPIYERLDVEMMQDYVTIFPQILLPMAWLPDPLEKTLQGLHSSVSFLKII